MNLISGKSQKEKKEEPRGQPKEQVIEPKPLGEGTGGNEGEQSIRSSDEMSGRNRVETESKPLSADQPVDAVRSKDDPE